MICNYMRWVCSSFYEKRKQCGGFVFLVNKLKISKLFNRLDKEDKHGKKV